MTELLTAAQMRAIEQSAMNGGAVTGLELMERAGTGVADAIEAAWPDMVRGRAVVLCGPGNNGGDGFVVARLLAERGWTVELFLYGDPDKLPPDAAENCRRWRGLGAIGAVDELFADHGLDPEDDLCFRADPVVFVDALFGTGLTRPLDTQMAEFLCDARENCAGKTVAVDFPSGHCADSGRALGEDGRLEQACGYDLTVTFHRPKTGHVTLEGAGASGVLRVVDIGLDAAQRDFDWSTMGGSAAQVARWIGRTGPRDTTVPVAAPALAKTAGAHKYDHGHALVLSGPPGRGGAARLAARAALRAGAGLVTVGCPMRAVAEHAAHLNAIMVQGLDGTHGLAEALEDKRITALCLGPGLGLGPSTGELVKAALAARRATVLDADALSRFQRKPESLFGLLHSECVLTPHAGEFARLFPDLSERLTAPAETGPAWSKLDATREAAARAGCVVLFKGPDTVVADPGGRISVVPAFYGDEAPWLATAGAGDVLAGIITGLLARGQSVLNAARNGAWLHGAAARAFGPGLIAEDLPETLPRVFRDMGL